MKLRKRQTSKPQPSDAPTVLTEAGLQLQSSIVLKSFLANHHHNTIKTSAPASEEENDDHAEQETPPASCADYPQRRKRGRPPDASYQEQPAAKRKKTKKEVAVVVVVDDEDEDISTHNLLDETEKVNNNGVTLLDKADETSAHEDAEEEQQQLKACPLCPAELCSKEHLLVAHNNVHPDEYLTIMTQPSVRKKLWKECLRIWREERNVADFALRCQNIECPKVFKSMEGLHYHVTAAGECRDRVVHVFEEEAEKPLPPPASTSFSLPAESQEIVGPTGRIRRAAAAKAQLTMQQQMKDMQQSDARHEKQLTDVAKNASSSRKRRRRSGSDSGSQTSSRFSIDSNDKDRDAEFDDDSLFSSSVSSGERTVSSCGSDSNQSVDDDDDDERRLSRKNRRRYVPLTNEQRKHAPAAVSFQHIFDALATKYLWKIIIANSENAAASNLLKHVEQNRIEIHSSTPTIARRRPSEHLRRRWQLALSLAGTCACSLCGFEAIDIASAEYHFTSACPNTAAATANTISDNDAEVYTVDCVLQCRICPFSIESYTVDGCASMKQHCSRTGEHATFLTDSKFGALLRDLINSTTVQSDSSSSASMTKLRARTDKIAELAAPYLCDARLREQLLYSNASPVVIDDVAGTEHLRKSGGATEAKIASCRANVDKLMRARKSAAKHLLNFTNDEDIADAEAAADECAVNKEPEWLQRVRVRYSQLPAFNSNCYAPPLTADEQEQQERLLEMCKKVSSPRFRFLKKNDISNINEAVDGGKLNLFGTSEEANVQIAYIGGKVTATAWLPLTLLGAEGTLLHQVLAVAVAADNNYSKRNGTADAAAAALLPGNWIQFWGLRYDKNAAAESQNIKLGFLGALSCTFGTVRSLCFMPKNSADSSSADVANVLSSSSSAILLAAVTDTGVCAVYSLNMMLFMPSTTATTTTTMSSTTIEITAPLFMSNVPPLLVLCLPRRQTTSAALIIESLPTHHAVAESSSSQQQQQVEMIGKFSATTVEPWKMSSIAWLPVAERDEILVGGDDGLIAVFRLSDSSALVALCKNDEKLLLRMYPVATFNIGRGLITDLKYCFAAQEEEERHVDDNLNIFIATRESKLCLYLKRKDLLRHAARAAVCGGGDHGLVAASSSSIVPIYWRAGPEKAHLTQCTATTNSSAIYTTYADAQLKLSNSISCNFDTTYARKLIDQMVQSEFSKFQQRNNTESQAAETCDARIAAKLKSIRESIKDYSVSAVNVAQHVHTITAMSVSGGDSDSGGAVEYPCLASADEAGNVHLNDMLLYTLPTTMMKKDASSKKSTNNRQEITTNSHDDAGGLLESAANEARRLNAWRNSHKKTRRHFDGGCLSRSLLTTSVTSKTATTNNFMPETVAVENAAEPKTGNDAADSTCINFRVFPEWSAESMLAASDVSRWSRREMELDRAELTLGREAEIAQRAVASLTWCPKLPVKYCVDADKGEKDSEDSSAKVKQISAHHPPHLIAFNEAGFMMLFNGALL